MFWCQHPQIPLLLYFMCNVNIDIYIIYMHNNNSPYLLTLVSLYVLVYGYMIIAEGSSEAKHPTIWTDEKQSREEAERRERLEERRVEEKD